jgi:NAD(P)-dependent dehydrogenase (short-subunit alcohol dehydrogenase family)
MAQSKNGAPRTETIGSAHRRRRPRRVGPLMATAPGAAAAGELSGEIAVVTGGAQGIGAAIVRALAGAGAHVAVVDIVDQLPPGLGPLAPGQCVRAWRCDVMNPPEIEATCGGIETAFGPVTILVNNVGGSGGTAVADIEQLGDELWERILGYNLGAMFRFSRRFVPAMKARRGGRIVNITSSLKDGVFGGAATVGARLPYVTAKSGVVGFTKQLAKDLGPFGVTVNAVSPGFTLPDEHARITQRYRALPPDQQRAMTADIPLGRPADGADIANAVLFLVSPRSAYVTGEIIQVAGGA